MYLRILGKWIIKWEKKKIMSNTFRPRKELHQTKVIVFLKWLYIHMREKGKSKNVSVFYNYVSTENAEDVGALEF